MICGRLLSKTTGVCRECFGKLQWISEPRCMCCGKPLHDERQEYCPECDGIRREFTAGIGVFPYRSGIRQAILDLKDHGKKENAAFLGASRTKEAASARPPYMPQCLVPIPLSSQKLRIRGYNQAQLLADELGKNLKLPVRQDILYRRSGHKEQKRLHRFARKRNQAGTFFTAKADIPHRVLLVDDIYTTGNTLEAAAFALKQAGAQKVYFVTVCMGTDF